MSADVLRTGRVARIDNYDDIEHRLAFARGMKIKSGWEHRSSSRVASGG